MCIDISIKQTKNARCMELMSSCDKPCVHDGISSRVVAAFILANSLIPGTTKNHKLHISIRN